MSYRLLCCNCKDIPKQTRLNSGFYHSEQKGDTCERCLVETGNLKLCIGCAIEEQRCQSCSAPATSPGAGPMKAEIAAHRRELTANRTAAGENYNQTIEPYKERAATYVAERKAEEADYKAALAKAREDYRIAHEGGDKDACKKYMEACEKINAASTARVKAIQESFPENEAYWAARKTVARELRYADGLFIARVQRSQAIIQGRADAETEFQATLDILEFRRTGPEVRMMSMR